MSKSSSQKTEKPAPKKDWRDFLKHGSGGHLAVIGIVSLLGIAVLIYALSQGKLERFYFILALLLAMIFFQLLLYFRVNRSKDK